MDSLCTLTLTLTLLQVIAVSTAAVALTCVILCRNKDRNEEVMRNREQRLAERKADTEIGSPFLLSWFGEKTTDVEDVSCLP